MSTSLFRARDCRSPTYGAARSEVLTLAHIRVRGAMLHRQALYWPLGVIGTTLA